MAKIGRASMVDASHQVPMLEAPLLSVINKINSVPGCYWYFSGLIFHNGRKLYEAAFQSSSTARIFKLSTLHLSPVLYRCSAFLGSIPRIPCIIPHAIPFHLDRGQSVPADAVSDLQLSNALRLLLTQKIQKVENHTLAGKQIKKMFVANL